MKPKIYLFCHPAGWGPYDVVGYALAEDGTGIASHLSSNAGWSQHDMGFTSDWKHDHYDKHYPDGYDLVWIDDPDNDPGVLQAMELTNKQKESER